MLLIVDDDNAVRLSIALAARIAHVESKAVSTEQEALQAVRDPSVDIVVLDMNLTLSTDGRQGFEILQKIKILRPGLPVILLTAWGTIPAAVEAMNLGAVDYITKPWDNDALILKVRQAIERYHATPTETLDELEHRAILEAMKLSSGNLTEAAARLGITRQALYRRLQKYKP